jgi:16S rRNA processing protein RimM
LPGNAEQFIVLGKIVDAYGVKGWVKIHPFADDPLAWQKMPNWWLRADDGQAGSDAWQPVGFKQCRMHGHALVACLDGVDDRTAAERLRGSLIGAPREALPATGADEYYWADLIGLAVNNLQGENLGQVADLLETGANDVLLVRDAAGVERLIPFNSTSIIEVDLAGKRVVADWGLDW